MSSLHVSIRTFRRQATEQSDAELGSSLVNMLMGATEKGKPAPVAIALRGPLLELHGITQLSKQGISIPSYLAALCYSKRLPEPSGEVKATGYMGAFIREREGVKEGRGIVFLEWEDCRWWFWEGKFDPTTKLFEPDECRTLSALEGDAMPQGLGRWWSLARRRNLTLTLRLNE